MKKMLESEVKRLMDIIKSNSFFKRIIVTSDFYEDETCWSEKTFWFNSQNSNWYRVDHEQQEVTFFITCPEVLVSEEEIIQLLKELTDDAIVTLSPGGSHRGSLLYVFG